MTFTDVVFGDSRAPNAGDWIQDSQDILRALKENMRVAQDQQKMYADRHRTERSFEAGDLVFLRLQPYRQSSLKQKGAEKLKPRYYGPYRITRKVGQVAYELELPEGSKIHNVFHVSCLKRVIGQQVVASQELPPLDDEGRLATSPEEILQVRERKLRNRVVKEFLLKWKDLPVEDATWENEQVLQLPGLKLLEDKQIWAGRTVMSHFP